MAVEQNKIKRFLVCSQLNAYNYIPPNLPSHMIQAYLQRLNGSMYQTGVEQELLLMSQMYSQMNPSGGSTGYGPLGAMFNSPSSGTTTNPYGSTSTNGNYFKSNLSPITTSSPSSSYTNIPSNVFTGITPLPSSSSSAAAAAAAQYNLSRYMPSYSTLTGTSNQASLSASSRPSSSPNAAAFPYHLYGSTATANNNTTTSAQQLATNQPGPNAIKNPLLSNLLPPSTSITKDSFSIPTSVITKATSKDVQRVSNTSIGNHNSRVSLSPTSIQVSRSGTPNVMNPTSQSHQSSAHSSSSSTYNKPMTTSKGSSLMAARASPLLSARGSPSMSARSSPSVNIASIPRSSPSEARSSVSISRTGLDVPNSLSITRTSTGTAKQMPMSITLAGSRNSPESNIIVKDVSAINRTVDRKSATPASSKTSTAQPIKNSNMGIVYPKTLPEKKTGELSPKEQLMKAAHNQLKQIHSGRTNNATQNRISLGHPTNRTASSRPVMTAINRISNVKSGNRSIDSNVSSSLSSSLSTAKSHSSPNLPTNEVTITPTKRLQRPMQAVNTTHKLTPQTMITPSTSQKPAIEINKLNNAVSMSRLPSSTSITRQIPIPSSGANTNKVVGRIQHPPSKVIPKTIRPPGTSMPMLKLLSQPGNNVQSINKTGVGISRPVNTSTAINRNQVPRVVASTNGVTRTAIIRPQSNAADVRRIFSSPAPKLANFAR